MRHIASTVTVNINPELTYVLIYIIAESCDAGHELVSGKCTKCAQGFYKSDKTEADKFGFCRACPGDLITESQGAINIDNCNIGQ